MPSKQDHCKNACRKINVPLPPGFLHELSLLVSCDIYSVHLAINKFSKRTQLMILKQFIIQIIKPYIQIDGLQLSSIIKKHLKKQKV